MTIILGAWECVKYHDTCVWHISHWPACIFPSTSESFCLWKCYAKFLQLYFVLYHIHANYLFPTWIFYITIFRACIGAIAFPQKSGNFWSTFYSLDAKVYTFGQKFTKSCDLCTVGVLRLMYICSKFQWKMLR